MKKFNPVFCGMTGLAFLAALIIGQAGYAQAQSQPADLFEGLWIGSPEIGDQAVPPIVFRIIKNLDGQFNAYLESPDRVRRIRTDRVTGTEGTIRLNVDEIGGSFAGDLGTDQKSVNGTWTQAGRTFPLVIKRTVEQPRPDRPQEPARPYPYDVEDIVCDNREAGVRLAGTLTIPRTEGPFPAVRLIGGSGPLNRDDECFGHRTFLVLADYLTRRGLAVLRLDKRGAWESGGQFDNATTKDFADDALASITYLKSRKDIDSGQIGLIGHSEGAMIAPMLAASSADIAFIVMIAGPGRPLDEVMSLQKCIEAEINGADPGKVAFLRTWYSRFYHAVKSDKDNDAVAEKIRRIYSGLTQQQEEMLGWSEAKLNSEIKTVLSPWWRYLLKFIPSEFLTKVECPVLAATGSKDLQVSSRRNLNRIGEALKAGGNPDCTIIELDDMNHLLQTAKTGAESEYGQIEETVSPAALQTIGDWIIAHVAIPTVGN